MFSIFCGFLVNRTFLLAVEALNKAVVTFKGAFSNLSSDALFMGYTRAEFLGKELEESLEKLKKSI